ncbi:MAG: tetratricopeptide repeat protein, partial [Verrucomicrobiota bacterium]
APFSEYAPRSLLNIGQVLRKNGENGQALLAFQEVVTTYPGTAFSTEAQFEIFEIRGINAERSNSPVEDRAQADAAMDFVNQNPEDARAQEVQSNLQEIEARSMEKLYNTGRFYEKSGKPDSARVYYREVVKNPNTPWAAKAQERLVIIDSAPAPAPERTSSIRERAGLFGSKPDPSETAEMRTGGDEVVELPSAE